MLVFLLDRLERFGHIDPGKLKIHNKINKYSKNKCKQQSVDIAYIVDMNIKGDHIDFYVRHNIAMQPDPDRNSNDRSKSSKNHVFAKYI